MRCVAAPCYSYTVRTLQGTEYSASGVNLEALDPVVSDWASLDLYEGRWLARGTIEATDGPRSMPHVVLRVEQLAQRVDTRAAELLSARLSASEDVSGHLAVLGETLASFAERTAAGPGPDWYATRFLDRLRAELDDLARLYDAVAEQSRRGLPTRESEVLETRLAELFGRVLVLAVRYHCDPDALATTWLVDRGVSRSSLTSR